MHILQQRLLDLAATRNLGTMKLRDIAALIGESHPQKVKHHLTQLEQKGLIEIDREQNLIRRIDPKTDPKNGLVVLPIVGSANCGPAAIFADENIQGYLKVSDRLVKRKPGLFAVRAVGQSMNQANIAGNAIDDGDYVIVDSEYRTPITKDYVLSTIDGVCNVKRLLLDEAHQQVVLVSESSHHYPPIVIHPDETEYFVNGKVIQVIKTPHH
jgi:repressor LexA